MRHLGIRGKRLLLATTIFTGFWFLTGTGFAEGSSSRLTVYAAASTRNAMEALAASFGKISGTEVQFDFASSGSLARRMALGAPADMFVSASPEWMSYLVKREIIPKIGARPIAGNQLVTVVPEGATGGLSRPRDLLKARRVAMGDPVHVPAGRYAREALRYLGLWKSLQAGGNLVFARDVRSALAYAENGEVDAAIVYGTDAKQSRRTRAVFTFPEKSHSPIRYYAAAVPGRRAARFAETFLNFTIGRGAQKIWERFGFAPLKEGSETQP